MEEKISLKQILFDLQLGIITNAKIELKSNVDTEEFIDHLIKNYLDNFNLENLKAIKRKIDLHREIYGYYYNDMDDIYLILIKTKENNKIFVTISDIRNNMNYIQLNKENKTSFIVKRKEI